MVSALAGLQRLEAQISLALSNAGAPSLDSRESEADITHKVENEAQKHMARASLALNDVDLMA